MAPHSSSPAPQKTTTPPGLSNAQLEQFQRDGYLIIPNYLSTKEVATLMNETHSLLSSIDISTHPLTRFSTGTGPDKEHVGDDYFLTSGDKIRFFFEEDAFSADGTLQRPVPRAINKIGHSLHTLSQPFSAVSLTAQTRAIAHTLGFLSPELLQSMIICKQPEIGGAVPPHQDSTFLYTDPPSAVGFWIALEDATQENGCLSFLPGSHLREPVRKRFVRQQQEGGGGSTGTRFEDVKSARFPTDGLRYSHDEKGWEVVDKEQQQQADYQLGEVTAGTLVLIHGNLLHKSEKNTSGKSRFIYTFHIIEGRNRYDKKNWLQPTAAGFSRLGDNEKTGAATENRLGKDW